MRASLISTGGPWLEATIGTSYGTLTVMDEFSIDARGAPGIGDDFEVELSTVLDGDQPWEALFSGNPGRKKVLEHLAGWSYRAFGEVVSIHPVVVDCGVIQIPDVFHSSDPLVVGDFVAFTITRLDATRYVDPNAQAAPIA